MNSSIKQSFNKTYDKLLPEVTLKHPSGLNQQVSVGWSFSPLLFGPLPHLFNGLYAYGFFMLLLSIILGGFTLGVASIIINFILAENLNRKVMEKLLLQGYELSDTEEKVQRAKAYLI